MLKKDIDKLSSIKSNLLQKKKIELFQNNEDGILGLGWTP